MKTTYLYRAVSLEFEDDAFTGDPIHWVGSTIGRQSGYLSRSSAVDAGESSGVSFAIVRSTPVEFPVPLSVVQAKRIADLKERLAAVSA
jgi:hypothetical protein